MIRLVCRAPVALLALLPACSDDSAGTATLNGSTTADTDDSSSTAPATTDASTTTTGAPTTSGTDSEGETTTGDPTTGDLTTGTTGTTSTGTGDTDTDTSTTTGGQPECGDGVVDAGEECDDGEANGPGQACLDGCVLNVCGDGDQGPQEGCDDGNLDNRDGCSDACVSESCGDGVTQVGLGEQCDDGNLDAEDGCSDACILEVCGDGVAQAGLGEQCDDGNANGGDGCSATCQLELPSLCPPGTVSVLVNEGFESGSLAPWTSDGATGVTMTNPHGGVWAAENADSFYVQQTFAAVPVAQLTSANFWTWHDVADNPAMLVEWGYSDNTTGDALYVNEQLNGWVLHDILPLLAGGKSIVRLTVWGYTGGQKNIPDITRFDDFRLCKKP